MHLNRTCSDLAIRFLGVGNADSDDFHNSSCVLEYSEKPVLMIDCGPDTLKQFRRYYDVKEPPAAFITHTHFDHIGGLESWFYQRMTKIDEDQNPLPKLFVPVDVIPLLQRRIADYSNPLAEGGKNFWDAFQLIPVSESFWLNDMLLNIFPVRHHDCRFAFGLSLSGRFLYTGDTKPIPEVLIRYASSGEIIFHDCCLQNNPSHTYLNEITREYTQNQWQRMIFYHYGSEAEGTLIEKAGFNIAEEGKAYSLDFQPILKTKDHVHNLNENLVNINKKIS